MSILFLTYFKQILPPHAVVYMYILEKKTLAFTALPCVITEARYAFVKL